MDELRIDRLRLRLPGLSREDAERLLEQLVRDLADLPLTDAAPNVRPHLSLSVESRPNEDLADLSARIAAELTLRLGGAR